MIFTFVDDNQEIKVEVDDDKVSTSYINLELLNEEEDEDTTERQEDPD